MLAYVANGGYQARAYRDAYPTAKVSTARAEACGFARRPAVAAALKALLEEKFRALQMEGDEALARVAAIARFNPLDLYGDDGKLLPISQWPAEAGYAIEALESQNTHVARLRFANKLSALRTILELTGKLKSLGGTVDALAAAIRADLEAHGEHHD